MRVWILHHSRSLGLVYIGAPKHHYHRIVAQLIPRKRWQQQGEIIQKPSMSGLMPVPTAYRPINLPPSTNLCLVPQCNINGLCKKKDSFCNVFIELISVTSKDFLPFICRREPYLCSSYCRYESEILCQYSLWKWIFKLITPIATVKSAKYNV